jgi:hypothetical protein
MSYCPDITIHRIVIWRCVLCGCRSLFLTLGQEHRLRVLENGVLREVFGSERDEVTGDWRKQYNETVLDLCCSPDGVRVIRSRGGEGQGGAEFCWGD